MSRAELGFEGGRIKVSGELTFASVNDVLTRSHSLLEQAGETIEVDLQAVKRVDSAGLALLIEWMRQARSRGKAIRFCALPEQMRAIAAASDLETILPLAP